MIIYVNGDSHSAGAELIKDYCFANDDQRYVYLGRTPHPEAIPKTFGSHLAHALNAGYFLDAESASSNYRILRTTKQFLEEKYSTTKTIIIGWSTWEREELWHEDRYYQLTASGSDSVPDELFDTYQSWVMEQTEDNLRVKQEYWHTQIDDFHKELQEQGIKHLFFNSMQPFNKKWTGKLNWDNCYIDPYNQSMTFSNWAEENGFLPANGGNHYKEDTHVGWYKVLLKRLTNDYKTSTINVTTVKSNVQPFTGLTGSK